MSKITAFFTELMRKYLPDPFVFAILLTLLTMVLAFAVESRPVNLVVEDWGKGFWSLLAFTTQMAVILVMGYVLARMCGLDPARVTFLCLFHDLHEARTGDFNYVNHRYDQCQARRALEDCVDGTGLEADVLPLWDELAAGASPEAVLAHDADQLDLICNLKAELDKGNAFASQWLESAVKRLRSPEARELAEVVLRTDHNRWWYGQVEREWWVRRGR